MPYCITDSMIATRALARLIRRTFQAALVLVLAVILWWTRFFTAIPETFVGSGPSMESTIRPGEYFTVTQPVEPLERGMLVVFRFVHEDSVHHVLRRLAALPGDTITMREGRAIVNGVERDWPFRILEPQASRSELAQVDDLYTWGPVIVPAGSVYLLSDTRDIVGWPDSRFIGPVRLELLEGKAGRMIWGRPGRFLRRLN